MWQYQTSMAYFEPLLQNPNTAPEQILDEDSLLSCLKFSSAKFAAFFAQDSQIDAVIQYALKGCRENETWTGEWEDEHNLAARRKSYHASEILSMESSLIAEALVTPERIQYIFEFIQRPEKNVQNLCFHFTKLVHYIVSKRPNEILSYLEQVKDYIDILLENIENEDLRDLYLIIASTFSSGEGAEYLVEKKLPERLVAIFEAGTTYNQIQNSALCISDILRCGTPFSASLSLVSVFQSEELTNRLLAKTFEGNPLHFRFGMQIITSMVELNTESRGESAENNQKNLFNLITARFADIAVGLDNIQTESAGAGPNKRCGLERIQFIELLIAILKSFGDSAALKIVETGLANTIIESFYYYSSNNIYHGSVVTFVQLMLEAGSIIREKFLLATKLLSTIQEHYPAAPSDGVYQRPKSSSPCYYGHLFALAKFIETKWDDVKAALAEEDIQKWEQFLSKDVKYDDDRRLPRKIEESSARDPAEEISFADPVKSVISSFAQFAYKVYSSATDNEEIEEHHEETLKNFDEVIENEFGSNLIEKAFESSSRTQPKPGDFSEQFMDGDFIEVPITYAEPAPRPPRPVHTYSEDDSSDEDEIFHDAE